MSQKDNISANQISFAVKMSGKMCGLAPLQVWEMVKQLIGYTCLWLPTGNVL